MRTLSITLACLWFFTLLQFSGSATSAQVIINEFQASNNNTIADEDGDYEDWIEIFNYSDATLNLGSYGLSDDPDQPFLWLFPSVRLESGEFLLVWASGKNRRSPDGELHTTFSISSDGEPLLLTNPTGGLVDYIPPVELPAGISYGRYPDGSDDFFFFDHPSPGEPNTGAGYAGILKAPEFSHPAGFYSNAFQLFASSEQEDVTIMYTTDGSVPDENSFIYDESGINVRNRTPESPVISLIPTSAAWQPAIDDQPQAHLIRARTYKDGYLPGPVKTATYFVNDDSSFDHHTLPILSISTNEENLFDNDTGIYVSGNSPGGNYMQSGIEWERPAYMELFNASSMHVYAGGLGLRIHGGTSRRAPQKSLRLYFRNGYGDEWLKYPLFGYHPVREFRRLILRNAGQDDIQTMLRDAVMQRILRGTNMDLQAYTPSVVYINGEYWGLHNIRERYDKYYISSHHGVDPENLDLLSYTNLEIGEGDRQHYNAMIEYINANGLSNPQNLEWLNSQMDIESYTDYKIAEIFFYRWDIGNIRHWRERTPEGRWRWMMFDLDTGMAGFWSIDQPWTFNMLEYATDGNGPWSGYQGHNHNSPAATFLLRKLLENEDYRVSFITRFSDMLNSRFRQEFTDSVIGEYASVIDHEMNRHINRWRRIESYNTWVQDVGRMREYAERRPEQQWQHLQDFFDLDERYSLNIDSGIAGSGAVGVNSLIIDHQLPGAGRPFPWTGIYFSGLPLKLQAMPYPGYRFDKWLINGEEYSEPELVLYPAGDLNIIVHYTESGIDDFLPVPFELTGSAVYNFNSWPESEPAGTYPPNMLFVYMDEADPGLQAEIAGIADGPYNLQSRTRINGLGDDGISFINTSNIDGNPGFPGSRLGGAILALDTRETEKVYVSFKTGTVVPNSREYGLRLQYRLGDSGPFSDITGGDGQPVDYIRNTEGHSKLYKSVKLPDILAGKPYIQLFWRYYYTGVQHDADNGTRAQLRIGNIQVSSNEGPDLDIYPVEETVQTYRLHQNYPNPFNPETVIRYELPGNGEVNLDIFNIQGQKVATLVNKIQGAGHHSVVFNAGSLSSGIYIYRLRAGTFEQSRKMMLIR